MVVAGCFKKSDGHGDKRLVESAENDGACFINVLMIIFMVAASLVRVDLPVSTLLPEPDKPPLHYMMKDDLTLASGDEPVLCKALSVAAEGDRQARIFLRADERVSYEQLMALTNLVRGAGCQKIALVGQRMKSSEARAQPTSFASVTS